MQSRTPRAISSLLSVPRIHRQLPASRTLSTLHPSIRTSSLALSRPRPQPLPQPQQCQFLSSQNFHSTSSGRKGITPDSADPAPPKPEPNVAGGSTHVTEPSPLTEEQYREYAEDYFNLLMTRLEELQEEGKDVEAEYSVRSPRFPPSLSSLS